MQIAEGMAVCWVVQAAAGGARVRKPGRITEITYGSVRLRVFDDHVNTWVCRRVRRKTLRRLEESALTVFEQLECAFPVARPEDNSLSGFVNRPNSSFGPQSDGRRPACQKRPLECWPQDRNDRAPVSTRLISRRGPAC